MRDHHLNALVGVVLTIQAATASAAVRASSVNVEPVADRVRLVEPVDLRSTSMLDAPAAGSPLLVSSQTRSATADVMNLPAEPIPTPPAFAMGMTVILGLLGYKAVRRLRIAA